MPPGQLTGPWVGTDSLGAYSLFPPISVFCSRRKIFSVFAYEGKAQNFSRLAPTCLGYFQQLWSILYREPWTKVSRKWGPKPGVWGTIVCFPLGLVKCSSTLKITPESSSQFAPFRQFGLQFLRPKESYLKHTHHPGHASHPGSKLLGFSEDHRHARKDMINHNPKWR